VVAQLDGRSQLQVHALLHRGEVEQQQRLPVDLLWKQVVIRCSFPGWSTVLFVFVTRVTAQVCDALFIAVACERALISSGQSGLRVSPYLIQENPRERRTVGGPDEANHVGDAPLQGAGVQTQLLRRLSL